MVTIQNDVRFLANAANATVEKFRNLTGTEGGQGDLGAY